MSLPRILLGVGADTMHYAAHVRTHGELPDLERRMRVGLPSPLVAELTRAALRGRGGGGFPLAAKIDAVQRGKGTPVVVVNATEGEPMSVKDRMLLEAVPHLVLDGASALAETVGTREVVIALDESLREAEDVVRRAAAERPEARRRGGQHQRARRPARRHAGVGFRDGQAPRRAGAGRAPALSRRVPDR